MISRILPVIFILIAIGLFFAYINPTYSNEIAALRSEIRGFDRALTAAEDFSEKKDAIVTKKAQLPEGGVDSLNIFLPDGVDNVQLILDLNAVAERSGLTLSDFDITENAAPGGGDGFDIEGDGPIESLDLSVSATGNYASFKTFLETVEWSLRPLDLIELDIEDSDTGVYTYLIKFRIYWLR